MSSIPLRETSNILILNEPQPPTNLLFEFPGADIILRSRDYHHFRVPKSYIVNCSLVLNELIRRASKPPDDARGEESLPIVQLPERGEILHSLFTFIFPVSPLVPRTTEKAMELLSVAKMYQMDSIMVHIRGIIARQNPPSSQRDAALHTYSLAQKYGLHEEALQAAQAILKYPMNIEDLEDKLDMMPGAALYELWNYCANVQPILVSDLTEFRMSGARGTLTGLSCVEFGSSQIPRWLDDYIESIGQAPNLFDFLEFNTALVDHRIENHQCACASIPSQTIRNFWEALTSVFRGSLEEAGSALSLVKNREDPEAKVNSATPLPSLDVSDADLIIRSSDLVNFGIHKSVLAMASPFFKDLLSLPQPADGETVDGLPVVQLSEDAGLLKSLISLLYPVSPSPPGSYEEVLYLLAACQKYDMFQIQFSIRARVNCGDFPAPLGTDVFRAHAIASSKGLVPEMEKAARLTLEYPMTFESLGEGLRLFDGYALRDLAKYRKRCVDNLVTCLKSFEFPGPGPSSIWLGCPAVMPPRNHWDPPATDVLPSWLRQVLSQSSNDLKMQVFTHPLAASSSIRAAYLAALQTHVSCNFCLQVQAKNGLMFCAELESKLVRARDKASVIPPTRNPFPKKSRARKGKRGSAEVPVVAGQS